MPEPNTLQKYYDKLTEQQPLNTKYTGNKYADYGINALSNLGSGGLSLLSPLVHPIETAETFGRLSPVGIVQDAIAHRPTIYEDAAKSIYQHPIESAEQGLGGAIAGAGLGELGEAGQTRLARNVVKQVRKQPVPINPERITQALASPTSTVPLPEPSFTVNRLSGPTPEPQWSPSWSNKQAPLESNPDWQPSFSAPSQFEPMPKGWAKNHPASISGQDQINNFLDQYMTRYEPNGPAESNYPTNFQLKPSVHPAGSAGRAKIMNMVDRHLQHTPLSNAVTIEGNPIPPLPERVPLTDEQLQQFSSSLKDQLNPPKPTTGIRLVPKPLGYSDVLDKLNQPNPWDGVDVDKPSFLREPPEPPKGKK